MRRIILDTDVASQVIKQRVPAALAREPASAEHGITLPVGPKTANLIAGVIMHATVARVQLTSLEIHVSGTFDNVLKWAGIEAEGNRGYRGLDLQATISGDADDDTLRDIWDRAVSGSPVAQTVNRQTAIVATLDIV